jgi:branched-chain amino acid transport system ATP-binding protein
MKVAALEVHELRSGYGQQEVLHGIDLTVGDGESVGLIGPNGHGKSTLMSTIAGLLTPTGGSVEMFGEGLRASPRAAAERGLVLIPQATPLFPDLTIAETLRLGAYLPRARKTRAEALENVFEIFPRLRERRDQLCRTLSGGERQMAAIGVGLMMRPRLLMLDEPTLGLAPKVREELQERIGVIRESGVSLLIADGDIDFLESMVDRWCLLESGAITLQVTGDSEMEREELLQMYFGGTS